MKSPIKPTAEQIAKRRSAPLTPDGFFADGPTLEEFVKAGLKAEGYPPNGYAPREVAKPITKFYEAHNSNRPISAGGLQFSFSPYAHLAGTWMGTYKTSDPKEIVALDELVKKGKIYDMTAEVYDNCMKKKAFSLQNLGPSLIHSEAASQSHPSARLAEVQDTEPLAPLPPAIESAASIQLGETKMPGAEGENGA